MTTGYAFISIIALVCYVFLFLTFFAAKKNKHIKSYRLGVYGEGETGVTIVTLK